MFHWVNLLTAAVPLFLAFAMCAIPAALQSREAYANRHGYRQPFGKSVVSVVMAAGGCTISAVVVALGLLVAVYLSQSPVLYA